MRRIPRWLVFTAVLVVLALGSLTSISIGTVRRSFPLLTGEIAIPGLGGQVEVLRDGYGVPQIYADNPEDLFEAQGFVHAQDRFYEMDFRRHLAAGRLSELYGPSQVETDAYIRTLGWRRVAEQELGLLSPSTRRYLDAYASGVNAYLRSHSPAELSLEYSILGLQGLDYTPEDWTAADSVAWLKVMAWDLSSNRPEETDRALVTDLLGERRAASLFPSHPFDDVEPIVGRGTVVGKAFDPVASRAPARALPKALTQDQLRAAGPALRSARKVDRAIPDVFGDAGLGAETGSNSLVVSGARTATGRALLANDPHVETSIPSLFAQVGLHCRVVAAACPFDVTGFSLASMPGVVIGRNANIAWGLSTSYVDVQDLYLEEIQGDTVRRGRSFVPLTKITEQIVVRGEVQPRTITIRASQHGPLLSDVDDELRQVGTEQGSPAPFAVALSWVALTPGRSMDAVLGFDRAQDFAQFRKAAALLTAPSQNLVYADVAGNIGYQLPGAIPIRGRGDGTTPSPGWDATYDWKGTIPTAELPYVYNPPSGFIVAANQQIIGAQYPYELGTAYSYGWRSQQIVERLRDASPLTMDAATAIFTDNTVGFAAELVPALLKIKVSDAWVAEGQKTLVGWDYSADAGSAAAAYFNVVCHNVLLRTFRDELPEDLWPSGGDRWYAVISELLDQPRDAWWDDASTKEKVETRDDILLQAMTDARKQITSLMARDTDEWQWGKLHTVTLRNSTLGTSGIAPVEALFNRGRYAVGGGPTVVDAMAYDDLAGYAVTQAPTMRMLVDLGDPDGSRWVNQSGVSGHAFHRHYADQTELWAAGRLWPFVSSRAAVEVATRYRLQLTPSG